MAHTYAELFDPDCISFRFGRYTLRSVLPQDERALGEFIERLSPAARYARFHGALRQLPNHTLRGMTQIDHRRQFAVVVTTVVTVQRVQRELIVADARYVVDDDGQAAEIAIVVDDRWHRNGIATHAMRSLAAAAQRERLQWLHGSVLSSNTPMLSLMWRCGFCCTPDRHDSGLVHAERRLSRHADAA